MYASVTLFLLKNQSCLLRARLFRQMSCQIRDTFSAVRAGLVIIRVIFQMSDADVTLQVLLVFRLVVTVSTETFVLRVLAVEDLEMIGEARAMHIHFVAFQTAEFNAIVAPEAPVGVTSVIGALSFFQVFFAPSAKHSHPSVKPYG